MNDQEKFWSGDFGNAYIDRNASAQLLASNISMFGKVMACTSDVESIIELGANIGMNLDALHLLLPKVELTGLEINQAAFDQLVKKGHRGIYQSIMKWYPQRKWTMSMTKGLLIHIAPENLPIAYQALYNASSKYILIAEYYSPTPVEIPYRDHANRLWKRDFCGDMLAQFKDLKLIAYGFEYRNGPQWPQDDINWFLMEKAK